MPSTVLLIKLDWLLLLCTLTTQWSSGTSRTRKTFDLEGPFSPILVRFQTLFQSRRAQETKTVSIEALAAEPCGHHPSKTRKTSTMNSQRVLIRESSICGISGCTDPPPDKWPIFHQHLTMQVSSKYSTNKLMYSFLGGATSNNLKIEVGLRVSLLMSKIHT